MTPLPDSPQQVEIVASYPHSRTSSVDLTSFATTTNLTTTVGTSTVFALHLRDMYGNYADCGAHEIEVGIKHGETGEDVPFAVMEKKTGVYSIEFNPPLAGNLNVECKMQALVNEGAGVRRGSFGDGRLPLDPFRHQYDEPGADSKAQKFHKVNMAGAPFTITVLEVPFGKRMKASESSVEAMDDSYGGCWRRTACLGGGSIVFVRLQVRKGEERIGRG